MVSSLRVIPATWTCSTSGLRVSSLSSGRTGWRRWMSSVAVADHQRDLRRAQMAGQVGDEVAGRRISPVQVLDPHEQPGPTLTHRLEQRHGLFEDRPRAHLAPGTTAGQQRPELGRHVVEQPIDHLDAERRPQPTQHLDERAVADPDVTRDRRSRRPPPHRQPPPPVGTARRSGGSCRLRRRHRSAPAGSRPVRRGRHARVGSTRTSRPTNVGHVTRFATGSVCTSPRASRGPANSAITMLRACGSHQRRASGPTPQIPLADPYRSSLADGNKGPNDPG